ncbi:helix-turn-helix domain-containing protein [Microcystis phage MinS1]|nr:helix-turn-helix domain-containing protein [Microcystis phage MinS1]
MQRTKRATQPDPWRLIVRLKSKRALNDYAEFHKLSGRALARKAGLGQAIVGHLMSGRRTTCSLATARALEEALGCPSGFLFEPTLSGVADTNRQRGAA